MDEEVEETRIDQDPDDVSRTFLVEPFAQSRTLAEKVPHDVARPDASLGRDGVSSIAHFSWSPRLQRRGTASEVALRDDLYPARPAQRNRRYSGSDRARLARLATPVATGTESGRHRRPTRRRRQS